MLKNSLILFICLCLFWVLSLSLVTHYIYTKGFKQGYNIGYGDGQYNMQSYIWKDLYGGLND